MSRWLRTTVVVTIAGLVLSCGGVSGRQPSDPVETVDGPAGTVLVAGGPYKSGAPKGESGEKTWPEQTIELSAFFIDRLEISGRQYQDFVRKSPNWQKGRVDPSQAGSEYLKDFVGHQLPAEKNDHPVAWVSWYAADAYCRSIGKRLPTAAEWEKAARGTDGRVYPWAGGLARDKANYCDRSCRLFWRDPRSDDGFSAASPVGTFPAGASPYGVLDMAGNALEWVADWLDDSAKYYKDIPRKDPTGPSVGSRKVLRGGSWIHNESFVGLRSYIYFDNEPAEVYEYVGFRCAMDAPGR